MCDLWTYVQKQIFLRIYHPIVQKELSAYHWELVESFYLAIHNMIANGDCLKNRKAKENSAFPISDGVLFFIIITPCSTFLNIKSVSSFNQLEITNLYFVHCFTTILLALSSSYNCLWNVTSRLQGGLWLWLFESCDSQVADALHPMPLQVFQSKVDNPKQVFQIQSLTFLSMHSDCYITQQYSTFTLSLWSFLVRIEQSCWPSWERLYIKILYRPEVQDFGRQQWNGRQ